MNHTGPFCGDPVIAENILSSTKQYCGFATDEYAFDTEFVSAINTALLTLRQLGLPIPKSFAVKTGDEEWTELEVEELVLEAVKSYVGIYSKLKVDPPTSSFAGEALRNNLSELEWRINADVDPAFEGGRSYD